MSSVLCALFHFISVTLLKVAHYPHFAAEEVSLERTNNLPTATQVGRGRDKSHPSLSCYKDFLKHTTNCPKVPALEKKDASPLLEVQNIFRSSWALFLLSNLTEAGITLLHGNFFHGRHYRCQNLMPSI